MDNFDEILKFFGTQQKMAEQCGVSQAAVSKWKRGKGLPSAKASVRIEKATNRLVAREDLRPDIFG
jgi:DNA-binding transcriptional regulator YdaS (Cro superfamily)